MTAPPLVSRFRELHESGCFVLPNPWDLGSAKVLVQLGFKAVATTSCGLAWTLGVRDHAVTLEQKLAHLRVMTAAVPVPVNADFEKGFAVAPVEVAANVTAAAATGIAGLSIEDSTGDPSNPLFDLSLAVERMRAAREALDKSGTGVLLTGRSEGFLVGRPDLAETIRRLRAYADAGAECLYAPGLRDLPTIRAVVSAVKKPVNVVMSHMDPAITAAELAAAGVKRISVGGSLSRLALAAFLRGAREMKDTGGFTWARETVTGKELKGIFARWQ